MFLMLKIFPRVFSNMNQQRSKNSQAGLVLCYKTFAPLTQRYLIRPQTQSLSIQARQNPNEVSSSQHHTTLKFRNLPRKAANLHKFSD
jgi:hypothetical protein